MPAQSPTLSPTLSAITAGLRGSSSGMPASTLPTRSAPTSAPLVKMPPPRPGEDRDQRAAEAQRHHRLEHAAQFLVAAGGHVAAQHEVVAGDAEKAEADHQHSGHGAGLEGEVEAGGKPLPGRLGGADIGAHRDVHAGIARRGRQHRADDEADRDVIAMQRHAKDDQDHHAHDADRGVLAVEIGAGALLDGGGDLLHAGGAGVRRQHLLAGDHAVEQRHQTADDDHVLGQLHPGLSSYGDRCGAATAMAKP